MAALGDRDLALNLLVAAAFRCYWGNLRADGETVVRAADAITEAAGAANAADGDQRMLYIQAFAAPIERGALVLREHDRTEMPDDPTALYLHGIAICLVGAFDRAVPLLAASVRRLRAQGRLRLLAQVLSIYAWASIAVGDFAVAMPAVQESRRLAGEVQWPLWETGALIGEATIAALRGDRAAVAALTADADRMALPIGAAGLLSLVQYARGMVELGHGRPAEAYEHLRRIYTPGDPAAHDLTACQVVGDFTEAAVRSGHREHALAIVRELEPVARLAQSPCVDMHLRYARVQLVIHDADHATDATDEEVERAFAAARNGSPPAWPVMQARTELAYGEWLRRRRRQIESRAPLRTARDAFDALGAQPWAERARQELRAAGESSEGHQHDTLTDLTPQELQIVQLVAQGLTNRAIAQRLYLSHRTIESHLYRVFPKLGVSSRAQLITALHGRIR